MSEETQKTEEQKEIEEIISRFVDTKNKDRDFYFKGVYGELFEEEEKHTDYQHEIFTKVIFKVLSVNEEGKAYKIPKVVEKNYYIPLPMREDYDKFIELFDSYLQEALAKAGKDSLEKNKE